MRQCEKCGSMIADGASFCTSCGAPLSSTGGATNIDGINSGRPVATVQPNIGGVAPTIPPQPNQGMGVQSDMNMQPSMGVQSDMNMQPNIGVNSGVMPGEEPKKKSNAKVIVPLVILSIVCLAVGIVGIVLALNNGSKPSGNGGGNGGGSGVVDGGGGGSGAEVSGTKLSFAGYEFTIPDGYEYEVEEEEDGDWLYLTNDEEFLAAIGYYNDTTFASLKNNVSSIAESFSAEYGSPITGEVKTVDGVEFVCFNVGEYKDRNLLIAASEAGLYFFEIDLVTNVGVDGTQYLSNVAAVLKTAKKESGVDKGLNGGTDDLKGKKFPTFAE